MIICFIFVDFESYFEVHHLIFSLYSFISLFSGIIIFLYFELVFLIVRCLDSLSPLANIVHFNAYAYLDEGLPFFRYTCNEKAVCSQLFLQCWSKCTLGTPYCVLINNKCVKRTSFLIHQQAEIKTIYRSILSKIRT